MLRKILIIITLVLFMITLSACNSTSQLFYHSHGENNYTYDPFWNNQRIVFRNVLVSNENYNPSIRNRSSSNLNLSFFTKQENSQKNIQNKVFIQSVKYTYGTSVNDSFNGVTEPLALNTISIPAINNSLYSLKLPVLSQQSLPTISAIKMNPLPQTNLAQEIRYQQLTNDPPGTTCQPLTFPIPPPPALIKELNMQTAN